MASSVATPLERQFGRIAGINQMTSSSQLGSTGVTMQFDLDRNIDAAARDVQAAINAARGYLPADLPSNPTYRKINPADAPVMILIMTSDAMTQDQMYDVADSIMGQKLAQVEGVGQVFVWGSSQPAVRIEANPNLLNKLEHRAGERCEPRSHAENVNIAKGLAGDGSQSWMVRSQRPTQEGGGLQADHRRLPQWIAGPVERCGRCSGFLLQHQQRGKLQRQAQRADRHLPPARREHDRHRRPRVGDAAVSEGLAAASRRISSLVLTALPPSEPRSPMFSAP